MSYELFFSERGKVSGRGKDCDVVGSFSWDAVAYRPRVEWKESHDWGTLTFAALLEVRQELSGSFSVSDGGGGHGTLSFVPPPEP